MIYDFISVAGYARLWPEAEQALGLSIPAAQFMANWQICLIENQMQDAYDEAAEQAHIDARDAKLRRIIEATQLALENAMRAEGIDQASIDQMGDFEETLYEELSTLI